MDKELKHCTTCNQMTNHRGDTCLKHMNDIEIEAKINEFENVLKELMGESSYSEYMGSFHKVKITTWLRSTLTTLIQKHEEEKAALKRGLLQEISHLSNYTQHDPTCICYLEETKECDCGLV